jgi:hypothetical protein
MHAGGHAGGAQASARASPMATAEQTKNAISAHPGNAPRGAGTRR